MSKVYNLDTEELVHSDNRPPKESIEVAWKIYASANNLPVERNLVECSFGYMLGDLYTLKEHIKKN